MLAKRNVRILKRLLEETSFLSIQKLSEELDITSRAIRYDLEMIDVFLTTHGCSKILRIPNKGICLKLTPEELSNLYEIIETDDIDLYVYNIKERQDFILDCFVNKQRKLTLQEMADTLRVSVSTIHKDIVHLKQLLNEQGITLGYKLKDSYFLIADEADIRNFYSKIYVDILKSTFDFQKKTLRSPLRHDILSSSIIQNIVEVLEMMEVKEEIQITDDSILFVIAHLYVMKLRLEAGCRMKHANHENQKFIEESHIYHALKYYQKQIERKLHLRLDNNEISYIAQYFLGARYISYKNDDDRKVYFQLVVQNFIQEVSKIYHYDFTDDKMLYENLTKHFEPMFNRLMLNVQIDNPLLSKMQSLYPDLYEAIKEAANVMSDFCGNTINDEELGYLCMHLGLVVNKNTQKTVKCKRIVIVCPSGYATSMMISTALETNYYVDVVKVLPIRLIRDELPKLAYDYIISTIQLDEFDLSYIKVSPILSFYDIQKLNGIFAERYEIKDVALEEIMEVIRKNCFIQNGEALEQQLSKLLKLKKNNVKKGKADKMLIDVINENLIELDVDVKDWKEAIRAGGALLVKQNIVKESYVEAMIDSAIKVGPYIVLEKGIALPHATPQDDTNCIGVSIITLKHPIEFGNDENDPVNLVICLASVDATSHMQVLSDIAKIFDGDNYYKQMINAKDKSDIMNIVTYLSNEE